MRYLLSEIQRKTSAERLDGTDTIVKNSIKNKNQKLFKFNCGNAVVRRANTLPIIAMGEIKFFHSVFFFFLFVKR